MAIDAEVARAVRRSVAEAGQPGEVAERLINWLEQASEEAFDRERRDEFVRRVYDAIDPELGGRGRR